MSKQSFAIGGVHPHDNKLARDCRTEVLPPAPTMYVSVAQHLGAPALPVVAVGDKVKVGQVLAGPGGFVSTYVHSPVSGTVKSIGPRPDLSGRPVPHIEIAVEGDEWMEDIDTSDRLITDIPTDNAAIIGATFPTHIKLSPPPGSKCERIIINGCECEPYLTSDYRVLLEKGEQVAVGAAIIAKVMGNVPCTIAIEENKPEAIAHMREVVAKLGYKSIEVMELKMRYPQGSEKQLIDAVMHRQVRSGGLPISVGAVVIDNTITVTGKCFPKQVNLQVRVGTPFSYIIDSLGGMPKDAAKVISGGPMMGKAVANLDASTLKGTSALLFLTEKETRRAPESACIRCGKCADACPMGLEPFLLQKLSRIADTEALEANAAQDCIECGCCLYSCPAHIPLLDIIRTGKGLALGAIRARAAAAKAAAEAAKK